MQRYIMVKKSPTQVGWGLLQRLYVEDSFNRAAYAADKMAILVRRAIDGWSAVDPSWRFKIVDPKDYGWDRTYYDDDDPLAAKSASQFPVPTK